MIDKFAILKWLMNNSAVLREIAKIVAGWSDALTLAQKLEVIYLISKAVLPVVETFPLWEAKSLSNDEQDEVIATAQAEYGIPIPVLLSVVAPIVAALIQVIGVRRHNQ